MRKVDRVRFLRASFEGVRTTARPTKWRGRSAYRVTINLKGLPRGIYVARATYRVSRNGRRFHRNTQTHLFRTCYGNVRGGEPEGPNRLPITIL